MRNLFETCNIYIMSVNTQSQRSGGPRSDLSGWITGSLTSNNQPSICGWTNKLFCPRRKYKNKAYLEIYVLKRHLHNRGSWKKLQHMVFAWKCASSSSASQRFKQSIYNANYDEDHDNMFWNTGDGYEQRNLHHDIVTDVFHDVSNAFFWQ